jgi:Transposase DDE domain
LRHGAGTQPSGGQVHDIREADERGKKVEPKALLADKGYDSDALIESLELRAITPVIPPKSNRKIKRPCDFVLCCKRNLHVNARAARGRQPELAFDLRHLGEAIVDNGQERILDDVAAEHRIPLSRRAMAMLRSLRAEKTGPFVGPFVFEGNKPKQPLLINGYGYATLASRTHRHYRPWVPLVLPGLGLRGDRISP